MAFTHAVEEGVASDPLLLDRDALQAFESFRNIEMSNETLFQGNKTARVANFKGWVLLSRAYK